MTTGSFPHDNFSSVYWIFNKLDHMIPLWKGKNPIYFGVITIIPFDNLHRQAYFVMHTFLGKIKALFLFFIFILWKSDTTFSSPFLFIKYSKTTYQKHYILVNIQNMKKMGHVFNRKKNGALNRGTLIHFLWKIQFFLTIFYIFFYLWNRNTQSCIITSKIRII